MFNLNRMIMLILLSAVFCLPAIAGPEIGKITRLKGRVTIHRNGAKIGVSATNGMDIQQNDAIKTKAKAYVRFRLSDGSIMTLGEKAELTLDSFTYNPEKKKRRAFFNIALGKLRVFANRMLKYRDNRFQIKTPTAVAGVRGTVFMVWVESPDVTRIACFDSAVEVASVIKPDEFVMLTKNILTSIKEGAVPSRPVLMTEKKFQEFQRGFEDDIKPVDEETGFKAKEDSADGNSKRVAPDPTLKDDEVLEVLELQGGSLASGIEGSYNQDLETIQTEIDLEPEPEPGPKPGITSLPAPPEVPTF